MRLITIPICLVLACSCGQKKDLAGSIYSAGLAAKSEAKELAVQPRNVILMIGDGMGVTQITAGLYSNGNKLNLERFPIVGLQKTHAYNDLITDSAAGATAFASGVKTYNGAIGVNPDTVHVKTLLEYAEEKGLATGMVSSSTIVHATPACFIAHQARRDMYEAIAADFLNTDIDIMIGGGKKYFDRRSDGRNLVVELEEKGYQVDSYLSKDLDKLKIKGKNFAYFTADSDPLPVASGRIYLPYASQLATRYLSNKTTIGFFLLVEGAQIDWGGHANDSDYIVSEMLDFDRAIGHVLDFAAKDGNTLVVVTADHETGGYAINHGSRPDSLVTSFTTGYHTADLVPVFAYGPGSEAFSGIYENTAIFTKIMAAYGWRK